MSAIANDRYVVQGRRSDGRVWAIFSTNDRAEAEAVRESGVTVDDRIWVGLRVWDRRVAILPPRGWDDLS
jgi:hypothetical protein